MELITHPDDWKDLTHTAPVPQHWAYGHAMERLGVTVLRGCQGGIPVQVLQRPGLRLIHRAPPQVSLSPLARHPGATVVSTPKASRRLIPLITARTHAIWSIAEPPDDLLAQMRPTWRHALQKARAEVRENRPALAEVLAKSQAQGRARGYRALPSDFVTHWPGGLLVLTCGAPLVAGAVFLLHGPQASYHAAWSSPMGHALGAPRALLWSAAVLLAAQGVRSIDLGAFDAGHPGLARFKLGTGAKAENLGPTSLCLPF